MQRRLFKEGFDRLIDGDRGMLIFGLMIALAAVKLWARFAR